jgi:hypothetical protein
MPIAAAVVAVIGIAILLMDLSARSEVESNSITGITMITSAVVTRAGATMLPTEPTAR